MVQVYRGRLRSTGEEVAVKVQRPGMGDTIALDMVLLRRLMAAIDANMPQLGRYQVTEPYTMYPILPNFHHSPLAGPPPGDVVSAPVFQLSHECRRLLLTLKVYLHDQRRGPVHKLRMGMQGPSTRMLRLQSGFCRRHGATYALSVGFRPADLAASDAAGGRVCGAAVRGARLPGRGAQR